MPVVQGETLLKRNFEICQYNQYSLLQDFGADLQVNKANMLGTWDTKKV